MGEYVFNTRAGQTIARELLLACANTGTTSNPVWSPVGVRVEDSSEEMDWGEETIRDILGRTYTTMKKPTITQGFDPLPLSAGDDVVQKWWQLAVVDQDAQALTNQDMLIVHLYASKDNSEACFAERYQSCMVKPSSLGGEGGGNINMPVDVTYGGVRTVGDAERDEDGVITFYPGGKPSV